MSFDGEVSDTAFNVHGTWSARLECDGGVLLPRANVTTTMASLADNQAYSFKGITVEGHLGVPWHFQVTQARVIGGGTYA